jgi:predicted dehydrogenase
VAGTIDVTIIGGGMFTTDVVLPTVYHLQRTGMVGQVTVCALTAGVLRALKENPDIRAAFPGQDFIARPDLSEPPDRAFPDIYKEVLAAMPPRQAVAVVLPDHLHYEAVKFALEHDQHVLCVKPLVLKYDHAVEIERLAKERGLFVGVEYHKRFDRRSLMARMHYRRGDFGEFVIGEAKMIEPYFYRFSNFQNWFTVEATDPFVYVGCHYVDLVYFITGLRPVELSVAGIRGRFPNGKEGYMWANGRVRYENGAILSVTDGLGYPDMGSGSNEQCLEMFCEGDGKSGLIKHDDQFRGVTHCYLEPIGCGGTHHNFVSPDFMRYIPWEGEGLKPAGYGADSVSAILGTIHRIEQETQGLPEDRALERRRELAAEVDEKGLIATPANSSVNELVMEAARMSILSGGDPVRIVYDGHPRVEPGHALTGKE